MTSTSQTLAHRMAAGRIPVSEALQIGMQLADQLRQLHEQGNAHGALTPAAVGISGTAVRLLPVPEGDITRFTSPEVAKGKPADVRSDIFSFGAVFFEMLTGRAAFDGSSPNPRPSGSPAVDRLVSACVAASPDARFQRAQKLMLELKLLSAAARRGTPAPAAPPVQAAPPPPAPIPVAAPAPVVNHQVQDLESRIAARLEEQERSVASVAQVANEVLKALREQQASAAVSHAPAPTPAPAPRLHSRGFTADPMDDHTASRLEKVVDAISDRLARLDLVLSSAVERLQKLEENLDAFDTDAAALRDSVTRDVRNFERALKAQNTAIESARTAMGQTDDLVERVVEALDALQSMFVNTSDEQSIAS
jgi:serine/threonine protein kinase